MDQVHLASSTECVLHNSSHWYVCAVASVVSGSLRRYGLQSTRLLCPWGFSRQGYWSGLPCPPPGDLSIPAIKPKFPKTPALKVDFLPTEPPGKPKPLIQAIINTAVPLESTRAALVTIVIIISFPQTDQAFNLVKEGKVEIHPAFQVNHIHDQLGKSVLIPSFSLNPWSSNSQESPESWMHVCMEYFCVFP